MDAFGAQDGLRRVASSLRACVISEKLPGLTPGGSDAVAAWMTQALQSQYQTTLLLADPELSIVELDRLFGTELTKRPITVRYISQPYGLRHVKNLRNLKQRFLVHYYRRIANDFDLLVNASGEGFFEAPGIQYIHFPRALQGLTRDHVHHRLYRKLVTLVPVDPGSFSSNLTLTNSKWVAAQIARAYGIPSTVLTPPIVFSHPMRPWHERERGFVMVGRLSPEKKVEDAFEILRRVRRCGFDVHIHVVGGPHDRTYAKFIHRIAHSYGDWISLEGQAPRARLEELIASHQYGIHSMREEHFGMAAAEMTRGGCIVFVPDGGGQVEVIDDLRTRYTDIADAASKICAILGSSDLQARVHASRASSAALMAPDEFCRAFLEQCRMFLQERNRRVTSGTSTPIPSTS